MTIEIHDPAIDSRAIAEQIQAWVAQRQAATEQRSMTASASEPLRSSLAGTLSTGTALTSFPGLNQAIARLLAANQLSEPQFRSSTPVVGGLIVAIRRWWNWMSTKWYVRPILRQQSEINSAIALLLGELAQWQELNAQRLAELQAQVEELQTRLSRYEDH